jgi:hypothetical protein
MKGSNQMSNQQILIRGTLAIAAILVATACSDMGGSSALGPTGLGTPNGSNASGGPEYADVSNQMAAGGGVYAADAAMLVRQPNGLRASVTIPTPESGTYVYPPGRTPGHPEVFTLWAFVFNYPNMCSAPCDANDLGAGTAAKGGVYNVGGHVASGNSMTIAGQIGVGDTPFNPAHAPLESPSTAEVHLAIAPHGHVDSSAYPNEFRIPAGSPPMWWIAIFH